MEKINDGQHVESGTAMSFERTVIEDHPREMALDRDMAEGREGICDSLGEHPDEGALRRCLLANLRVQRPRGLESGVWERER